MEKLTMKQTINDITQIKKMLHLTRLDEDIDIFVSPELCDFLTGNDLHNKQVWIGNYPVVLVYGEPDEETERLANYNLGEEIIFDKDSEVDISGDT